MKTYNLKFDIQIMSFPDKYSVSEYETKIQKCIQPFKKVKTIMYDSGNQLIIKKFNNYA